MAYRFGLWSHGNEDVLMAPGLHEDEDFGRMVIEQFNLITADNPDIDLTLGMFYADDAPREETTEAL